MKVDDARAPFARVAEALRAADFVFDNLECCLYAPPAERSLGDEGFYAPPAAGQALTLAGFHALGYSMFQLAKSYRERGMAAYSELQQAEFAAENDGYSATRHQREVGTGYFDEVSEVISGGRSSTLALEDSTETHQF